MIKKFLAIICVVLVVSSCHREFEKALKSNDPTHVLKVADKLYDQEKWPYAIQLYDKIKPNFVGTEKAEEIAYKSAMANYHDKNYRLAAGQFKNFFISYPKDTRAEEAYYMAAYCYYKGSPEYNLDQTNTYEAITQLQSFIDLFPNSDKVQEANELIKELELKLQKKAFEIAKSYYKTLKYKSSDRAFANFMDDFPDSKYREQAFMYMLRSQTELAIKSTFEKKEDRIINANTTYTLFRKAYPNSKYTKEAEGLKEDLDMASAEHKMALEKVNKLKKKNDQNGL